MKSRYKADEVVTVDGKIYCSECAWKMALPVGEYNPKSLGEADSVLHCASGAECTVRIDLGLGDDVLAGQPGYAGRICTGWLSKKGIDETLKQIFTPDLPERQCVLHYLWLVSFEELLSAYSAITFNVASGAYRDRLLYELDYSLRTTPFNRDKDGRGVWVPAYIYVRIQDFANKLADQE